MIKLKPKTTLFLRNKKGTSPSFGFVKVLVNLKGAAVRHEEMAGKKYLVVPMVMMTDGVHHGSLGPLYYPPEEFGKDPVVFSWNMKPVLIYHPTNDGTACTPETITAQGVGVIMNTQAVEYADPKDKKRKRVKWNAEAWLEEDRLKLVDERVYDKIKNGEMIEVSTGLFCESDGEQGVWNQESFEGTVRNYRADHLAILPDQKGACSLEDGAGLLRNKDGKAQNEASFDAKRGLISKALSTKYGEYACYLCDVFEKFFIFDYKQNLFKMDYTATDTAATLSGEPMEVVRVVKYQSPDGTVIANVNTEGRVNSMNKIQMVAALLAANMGFVEADRGFLMGKNEDQLKALLKKNEGGEETPAEEEEEVEETPAKPAANSGVKLRPKPSMLATNGDKGKETPQPQPVANEGEQSVDEYIAKAPKKIASMLANGLRSYEAQRTTLIEGIVKHSKLTKEKLERKDNDELEALYEAVVPKNSLGESPTYAGLADVLGGSRGGSSSEPAQNQAIVNGEGLPTDQWDFTPSK